MIESVAAQALAKVAEQVASKSLEANVEAELSRQIAQQETFRLGELTGQELREADVLKQREKDAAAELRDVLLQDADEADAARPGLDIVDRSATDTFKDGDRAMLRDPLVEEQAEGAHDGVETNRVQDACPDSDKPQIVQNKEDGTRREEDEIAELREQYPGEEGYKVLRERDLVDKNGNPVKDPETGEGRRVDVAVVDKDNNVDRLIEVTSPSASKEEQMAKEQRVRDSGGTYIRDPDTSQLYDISSTKTEIVRRA